MRSRVSPIWHVDAFTDRPFAGNPAAVCLQDEFPSDRWMQQVAAEMNLSETAFVVPRNQTNRFHLRWFTPKVEVELCGHATLAAAHVLFEQAVASGSNEIHFETLSGELACGKEGDTICLDFPATPPQSVPDQDLAQRLSVALGIAMPRPLLRSRFDLLVVAEDEHLVRALSPHFDKLAEIDARGVIVTAPSNDPEIDFVSRYFAPQSGINEDPVTGSAHCCLAPLWSKELGRRKITGYQASERGGTVGCEVMGDRVKLAGEAVTVLSGQLCVEAPRQEPKEAEES